MSALIFVDCGQTYLRSPAIVALENPFVHSLSLVVLTAFPVDAGQPSGDLEQARRRRLSRPQLPPRIEFVCLLEGRDG